MKMFCRKISKNQHAKHVNEGLENLGVNISMKISKSFIKYLAFMKSPPKKLFFDTSLEKDHFWIKNDSLPQPKGAVIKYLLYGIG